MDGANSLKCKLAVGGGIVAFLAILFVACMVGSIHTIQEGSVGIYYTQGRDLLDYAYLCPYQICITCTTGLDQIRIHFFWSSVSIKFFRKFLGALEDRYALPGLRFQKPFITEMREITIRPTTETMEDISTVTKDGIEIVFHGIQVLSSVDLAQLLSLVKKFGSEFRRVLIYDRVSEDLRLFCANHTIDEVILIYII